MGNLMIKRASAVFAAAMLALSGCSGEDGDPGATGAPGVDGTDGADGGTGPAGPAGPGGPIGDGLSTTETCALCHNSGKIAAAGTLHDVGVPAAAPYAVTLDALELHDNGTNTRLRVTFTVKDGTTPVTNLAEANVRLNLAKLLPGANGDPSRWVNYITGSNTRPTTETGSVGNFAHVANGQYTFRFVANLTDATANPQFDAAANHRIGFQISGTGLAATTGGFDFLGLNPAAAPTLTRKLVTTAACNACHERLTLHGSRNNVDYCVTCHNPGRGTGTVTSPASLRDGEILGDMTVMVHKAHMGHNLAKQGYDYAGVQFDHITYPQDVRNCTTCHKDAANADSWKTNYSVQACRSCHDDKWFGPTADRPAGMVQHTGGQAANDSCGNCHRPGGFAKTIEDAHRIYPVDAANFTYEIQSVTYDTSAKPVVKFRISKNGTPITNMHQANSYPVGNSAVDGFTFDAAAALKGFAGGPSFLIAYASPQDDVTRPADWNQKGRAAAQPQSVSVGSIIAGDAPDATGWYTRTLTAASIPADVTMRGVAIQGYFTQCATGQDKCRTDATGAYGRYTASVYKGPTGTGVAQRRVIVDNDKCLKCHKQLALHGGNRVNDVMTCVICHNPNLSSSGRAADMSLTRTGEALTAANETIAALGSDALTYPEDTQNFRDMIHAIHAGAKRTEAFDHVRDRGTSGVFYYDWSHVTYPGILKNCETCHKPDTYNVPAAALMTTIRTTTGAIDETAAQITAVRGTVPNLTDEVKNPYAAACNGCHTNARETAHMESMGAGFGNSRGKMLENR